MTRQLVLAYYVGAYGPTVRIDAQSPEELVAVEALFRRLASGEVLEAEFGQELNCRFDSIRSLRLRSVGQQPAKALELQWHSLPAMRCITTGECEQKVPSLDLKIEGEFLRLINGTAPVSRELKIPDSARRQALAVNALFRAFPDDTSEWLLWALE